MTWQLSTLSAALSCNFDDDYKENKYALVINGVLPCLTALIDPGAIRRNTDKAFICQVISRVYNIKNEKIKLVVVNSAAKTKNSYNA